MSTSLERSVYYKEVRNISEYRKELPLAYLAKKMLAGGRSRGGGDEDASRSSGSSAMVQMDPAEVEIMRLAVGKVVDGFTRLILQYYSSAWGSLIDMRDRSREKERLAKAIRLQNWFRGLWAKLAVRRKKEAIRLAEEERLRRIEMDRLERIRCATVIQSMSRMSAAKSVAAYKRALNMAALTIQRAWKRKKVVSKGMNEVARYWFLQDSAVQIQCAIRCYRSRILLAHLKRGKRHRDMVNRYKTAADVIRTNFEMHGAAARIQRWFRRLPYRILIILTKYRNIKARQIQRWYSHHKARRSTIAILLGYREMITARERAALLINPIVRGGTVRLRIKREKREAEEARQLEIEIARKLAAKEHADARRKRHDPVQKNRGFFGNFMGNMQHLDELNPIIMQKHKSAAIVIQKHMRRCLARRIRRDLEARKLQHSAMKMQKKFRLYTFRKARWRATLALEKIWMKVKRRRARKARAITKLQAVYRGRRDRRQVIAWKILWNPTAVIIQKAVRGFLSKMQTETYAQDLYWHAEFAMNGALMYKITLREEIRRQIFHHSMHFKSPHHRAELQCIFGHYCSMGTRGNTERLGVNMFIKLAKESDLLSKSMNQQKLELLFTHEKGKDTHLHYPQFLSALRAIANAKFSKVNKHGRYKGENARLLKLVQENIICTKSAKGFIKELKEERVEKRALRNIEECCSKIQLCFRDSKSREQWKHKFLSGERALFEAKKLKSLYIIQRSWRCALARYNMRQFALSSYQKIVDEHHGGQVYYFNVKTGNASWKKPIFLGKYDIDNPINMPADDRLYKMTCDFCAKVSATWYDIEDSEYLCDDCNEIVHSKGRRMNNHCVEVNNCVQCEFQVGTKKCVQCTDLYCDTCYFDQHKKGMLQKHFFDEVQTHCNVCKNYVALLMVQPGNEALCKPCYKNKFPWDKTFSQNNQNGFAVSPFEHVPPAVTDYWIQVEADKRKAELEVEFKRRKAEMDKILRKKSALLIQKYFRGMKGRHRGAIIMASRRQQRLQRQKDELKRQALVYQFKLFLGIAPELPSDTTKEKVLKRFPSRWADLISDVVDGKWDEAFKMINEQEKFLKLNDEDIKLGKKKKLRENMSVLSTLFFVANQKRTVRGLEKRKDKAQLAYRNARSDVGTSGERKEELKMQMRKAKHRHKKAAERLDGLVEQLKGKRDVIEKRKGPKKFDKHMTTVRKDGKRIQWRKRDVSWTLKRYEDVVVSTNEDVDVFTKKMIVFGARLRLGDKEKHGMNFYTVINPVKKLSLVEKLKDRINSSLDPERQRNIIQERKEAAENWNAKHIRLNRQWMYNMLEGEESSEAYLHVMPRELIMNRLRARASEFTRNNMLSQLVISRMFKTLGKTANFLEDISKKFDEDSDAARKFKKRTLYLRKWQQKVLMMSNQQIMESEGSGGQAMTKMLDKVSEIIFVVKKEAKNVFVMLTSRKKKQHVDPFGNWDKSEEKVDVVINWNTEEKDVKLGIIQMDIDAPASIAREYCRRNLRMELNERCGENFMMMARGEGLPLADEGSKRIGQLAPQKFNPKSREIEHTLLLCENKDENLVKAMIPVIKSEEQKKKELEFEKLKDEAMLMDEKSNKELEMPEEKKEEMMKALVNAGLKEKRVKGIFNRKGFLVAMSYNDLTKNMPPESREKFKAIIDEVTGKDSLGPFVNGFDAWVNGGSVGLKKHVISEEGLEDFTEEEKKVEMERRKNDPEFHIEVVKSKTGAEEQEAGEIGLAGSAEAKGHVEGAPVGDGRQVEGPNEQKTLGDQEEEEDDVWETIGDGGDGVASLQTKDEDEAARLAGQAAVEAANDYYEGYEAGQWDAIATGGESYNGWTMYQDDSGNPYYVEDATGASQYEYPDAWQQ